PLVAQWRASRLHVRGPSPGWKDPLDSILSATDSQRNLFGMPGRADRGTHTDPTGTVSGRTHPDHQRDARPPTRFQTPRASTSSYPRSQDSIPPSEGITLRRIE